MVGQNPLGRYATIGALAASLIAVVAAIAAHLIGPVIGALIGAPQGSIGSDAFLDNLAYVGFLVLVGGQRVTTSADATAMINGQAAKVEAAHRRLDAISAPPADGPAH